MNRVFKALGITALAATAAGPLYAQEPAHRADSGNSVGRIFLTSARYPQLQNNIAVTRVSGNIVEGPANAPSAVNFTLYPADQNADGSAKNTDATIVKFQSHNIQKIDDQTYRASGQLTVTYVVQVATTGPSLSYAGPTYGQAATYSVNHDATAELRPAYHAGTDGAAGYTDWNVKTSVAGHSFPELLVAVSSTRWPEYRNTDSVVADEVHIALNLRIDGTAFSLAGSSGK